MSFIVRPLFSSSDQAKGLIGTPDVRFLYQLRLLVHLVQGSTLPVPMVSHSIFGTEKGLPPYIFCPVKQLETTI